VIPKPGKNGHYATKKAEGEIDPPEWPKMEFIRIIETAFGSNIVRDAGHRLVKRLLGRRG
jgi:hypothetical protein